jgi:hypothetical protein
MMTKTETAAKDGLIPIKANSKVWHTINGLRVPDERDMVYLTLEEAASARIFSWDKESYELIARQQKFFGGRLIYWAPGNWRWIDGNQEERVKPRTLADNYPALNHDQFDRSVEIPESLAQGHEDLAWVLEGDYPVRKAELTNYWNYDYELDQFSRKFLPGELAPSVFVVPESDWNQRGSVCLGVTWSPVDQSGIFAKAGELGWEEGEPI